MSVPGSPLHFRDAPVTRHGDLATYSVLSDPHGSGLDQRVLVLDGTTSGRVPEDRDEVFYVTGGTGELEVGGEVHQVAADVALRVAGGSSYVLRSFDCTMTVVAISGAAFGRASTESRSAQVDPLDQEAKAAVSNREYRVLFDAASGCSGLTQFLGYVPDVRTAMHIHPYSEMIYIVEGTGTVEIDGQSADVSPGWCYYLPEGVPHRVENKDPHHYLVELGVFTPSGSPEQNTPV